MSKKAMLAWEQPIKSIKHVPALDIRYLTEKQKDILWQHLKNKHPSVATDIKMMMQDSIVQDLINMSGASLVIKGKYVPNKLAKYMQ